MFNRHPHRLLQSCSLLVRVVKRRFRGAPAQMNPSGQNSKLKAPADPFTDNVKADIVAKPHQVRLRPHASALFTAAVPLDSRKRYHEPQRDKKKDIFRFPSNSKDEAIVEIEMRVTPNRLSLSFDGWLCGCVSHCSIIDLL